MTPHEALILFDEALRDAMEESPSLRDAVAQILRGGLEIEGLEVLLHLRTDEPTGLPQAVQSDEDFLRAMRIAPDAAPGPRKHFGRWPTKKPRVALPLVGFLGSCILAGLFCAYLFAGCANVRVDLGCQPPAPGLAGALVPSAQKRAACGLRK